jgi:hypothetical protein
MDGIPSDCFIVGRFASIALEVQRGGETPRATAADGRTSFASRVPARAERYDFAKKGLSISRPKAGTGAPSSAAISRARRAFDVPGCF